MKGQKSLLANLMRVFSGSNDHASIIFYQWLFENHNTGQRIKLSISDVRSVLNCGERKAREVLIALDAVGLINRDGQYVIIHHWQTEWRVTAMPDYVDEAIAEIYAHASSALSNPYSDKHMRKSRHCVKRWLDEGFDLHSVIIPTINAICHGREAGSIYSWSFFNGPIFESAEAEANLKARLSIMRRQFALKHGDRNSRNHY